MSLTSIPRCKPTTEGFRTQAFRTGSKKYASLILSEMRRLRQFEEENAKLKPIVAELPWKRSTKIMSGRWISFTTN